jgi:hypothetical protein
MPWLPVAQSTGEKLPVQSCDRGREALQQFTPKVIEAFGVLLNAIQTGGWLVARLRGFGVSDTDDQPATIGIGECADSLVEPCLLATDALEVQRLAFRGGKQCCNLAGCQSVLTISSSLKMRA